MFFETYLGEVINLQHIVKFSIENTMLVAYDVNGEQHEVYNANYSSFEDKNGIQVKMSTRMIELKLECMIAAIISSQRCEIVGSNYLDDKSDELLKTAIEEEMS